MARNKAPAELFIPGDLVQVSQGGSDWRNAIIISFAGYGGGYYYRFDPLPKPGSGPDGISPSEGGWTCDRYCRARS